MVSIWRQLTEPARSVRSPEHRRRARLLASLLLVLVPLYFIPESVRLITDRNVGIHLLGVTLVIAVAYALSRTRYYKAGIVLALTTFTVLPLLGAVLRPEAYVAQPLNALVWAIPNVLLGSLLLSIPGLIVLIVSNVAVALLFPLVVPGVDWAAIGYTLGIYSAVFSLLLVAAATRRKYLEAIDENMRALAASEARYRHLFHSAPDGLTVLDVQGNIVSCNQSALKVFQRDESEVVGHHISEFLAPSSRHEFARSFPRIKRLEFVEREIQIVRGDGSIADVWRRGVPLLDTYGRFIGALVYDRDITARKRAEVALRNSEAKLRALIETSNDAVVVIDDKGLVTIFNPAAERMFVQSREEMIGQPLQKLVPPEYREKHRRSVASYFATGKPDNAIGKTIDLTALRSDGTVFPIALSLSAGRHSDGKFVLGIIRDITARKQAEEALRRYTVELEKRNAELDAFAHTVAHDLKSLLTGIVGYASLLRGRIQSIPQDKVLDMLGRIESGGNRMRNVIDELLLLASVRGMEEVDVQPLDMGKIVDGALERLQHMVADYRAEIVLPQSWPVAVGYGPWVEEIWVNYISNAIKYGGQPPRVEMGATLEGDGQIRFWVRDNGVGISAEERERVFLPFERLHKVRTEGHGLGLSIVRRIADRLGGRVGVESQVGQGSTFYFVLPAADGADTTDRE